MARSTLEAVTQLTPCSPERPPNTTATRGLRVDAPSPALSTDSFLVSFIEREATAHRRSRR